MAALALLLPNTGKSQDSSTIQGLLQYIMQPIDKNQIGVGYLEEYGFPAISMFTYNIIHLHCIESNQQKMYI